MVQGLQELRSALMRRRSETVGVRSYWEGRPVCVQGPDRSSGRGGWNGQDQALVLQVVQSHGVEMHSSATPFCPRSQESSSLDVSSRCHGGQHRCDALGLRRAWIAGSRHECRRRAQVPSDKPIPWIRAWYCAKTDEGVESRRNVIRPASIWANNRFNDMRGALPRTVQLVVSRRDDLDSSLGSWLDSVDRMVASLWKRCGGPFDPA